MSLLMPAGWHFFQGKDEKLPKALALTFPSARGRDSAIKLCVKPQLTFLGGVGKL